MSLCTITGTLRWPDGQPAPGEMIQVLAPGIRASGDGAAMPAATHAVSDEHGAVSFDLMPGPYRLEWRGLRVGVTVPGAPSASLQDIIGG